MSDSSSAERGSRPDMSDSSSAERGSRPKPSDVEELRARLLRYPADRFPVQHATAQLHLGAALLQAGSTSAAVGALRVAIATYDPTMLAERATAANLLGAALRDAGRAEEAGEAFVAAAAGFAEAQRPLEEAAALHNLGLTLRDRGDLAGAAERFAAGLRIFSDAEVWAQAAAAARELAGARLEAGDAEAAAEAAADAVAHADRAGDLAGVAAAENVLGLAALAGDRPREAADRFARSAAASPRRLRPEAYAMAQANRALACEEAGEVPRARVLARQALSAPAVPPVVGQLAGAILDRLGEERGDLHAVLAGAPDEREVLLRDELTWWVEGPSGERRGRVAAFLDGLPGAPDAEGLTAVWIGVLLELPPADMHTLVQDAMQAVAACPAAQRARIRGLLDRALPRYPMPQWQRLATVINDAAGAAFGEPAWL
jgi:tetratricopeptide (TPR) repeat protein